MKPSDFQKTIQCQFDCKLKKVVKGIVRNYRKELARRQAKEVSFCELPEIVVEKLIVWDDYESEYTTFDVCGTEIRVLDEELAEALKQLPEQSRNIVLMFFFLDMSDSEIGEKLNINRSTSYRHRKVKNVDGQPHLCLDSSISAPGSSVDEMLRAWMEQSDKLENGEISKEEYDEWRYKYPELDTYQKRAKIPSQELSDYLLKELTKKEN